jgi:hypothetical protein
MIPAIFVAIGAIFIALLAWLAARLNAAQDASRIARARVLLVPSRLVVERICSKEDLDFVTSKVPGLRTEFVRQRKALLLLWLKGVRRATAEAVGVYRASVRANPSLEPATEIRLAIDYLRFLLLWQLARFLVLIANPVTLRSTISGITAAAEQLALCTGSRSLEFAIGPPVARGGV